MKHKLVMEDKQLKHKTIPIEDVNSFWLEGEKWDITIGEDNEGNPYVSIAIGDENHELVETKPAWKGRIIKIMKKSKA
jgi:hypothetical protein